MTDIENKILDVARSCNLDVLFRKDHPDAWDSVVRTASYFPNGYSAETIDYQHEYLRGNGKAIRDVSLVLKYADGKHCAIWPLSIVEAPDPVEISTYGGPIFPPLFTGTFAHKSERSVIRSCLQFLREFALQLAVETYALQDFFTDKRGISEWHITALREGCVPTVIYDLFVDLTYPLDKLRTFFRQSHKNLINVGARLWRTEIARSDDFSTWEEFRNLHLAVSGRETRSRESWSLQYAQTRDDKAFLVTVRDQSGTLVGGGFFKLTADEAVYSVAAFDRSLFDKPLGHVVQYRAIEEMIRRKIRWYLVGQRFFGYEVPPPSEKELSISDFKEGFRTHVFPRYLLQVNGNVRTGANS